MFLTKAGIFEQSRTVKDNIDGLQYDYISSDSDLYSYLIMWYEYRLRNKNIDYDDALDYERDFQNLTKDKFKFKKNDMGRTVGLIWTHGCGYDIFDTLVGIPNTKDIIGTGYPSQHFENFVDKKNMKSMIQLVKDYES